MISRFFVSSVRTQFSSYLPDSLPSTARNPPSERYTSARYTQTKPTIVLDIRKPLSLGANLFGNTLPFWRSSLVPSVTLHLCLPLSARNLRAHARTHAQCNDANCGRVRDKSVCSRDLRLARVKEEERERERERELDPGGSGFQLRVFSGLTDCAGAGGSSFEIR